MLISTWQEACGNLEISKMHRKALQRLVFERGGLKKLGFNGVLAKMVVL
jgi:hypothetical protein